MLPVLLIGCGGPPGVRAGDPAEDPTGDQAVAHAGDPPAPREASRLQGLNAANLAAMVAEPADLVLGRGDPGPGRRMGARAVIQLWDGAPVGLQPQGGGPAPGAASPGPDAPASGGSGSAPGAGSPGGGSGGPGGPGGSGN